MKEHWNKSSPLYDAIVTETPSAHIWARISGVHVMRADETEVDPWVNGKAFYFSQKAPEPVGQAAFLADLFMIDISLFTFIGAGSNII